MLHSQDYGQERSDRFSETGPAACLVAVFLVRCRDMSMSCAEKEEGIVPTPRTYCPYDREKDRRRTENNELERDGKDNLKQSSEPCEQRRHTNVCTAMPPQEAVSLWKT